MSWIDKKYKNYYKEQKYPESMKQKGWDSMQGMLDKQMPASASKVSTWSNPWYLAGVAAVVVTLVGIPFFIANQPKELEANTTEPTPIIENSGEEVTRVQNSQVETANFVVDEQTSSGRENQGKVEDKTVEKEADFERANASMENAKQNSVVSNRSPLESVDHNESVEEESITGEIANGENFEEQKSEESSVASENLQSDEDEIANPFDLPSGGKSNVFPFGLGMEDTKSELVSREVPMIKESEEGPLNLAQLDPAPEASEVNEELTVKEVLEEETVVVESKSDDDLNISDIPEEEGELADNSASTSEVKAAHLAFLEADEQAPIPDLLTFSKERFSVSIWGAYLFTGKVLNGGAENEVEKRKNSEGPVYTTPTGVGLDYFVNKNWTVGVGLGWAEYGEEVDYTLYNVTSTIDSVAFDGRYDSPSNYPNIVSVDSTRVIDTINQGHWDYSLTYRKDDSTANSYSGRNTFRYIEVPLTIGYRFGTGRLKPWVKAGVILGLPVEASYRYPQFETATYVEGGSKAGLAAVQYSGVLQLGADFYINRSLSVRLNALGTYQLNAMLTNNGIRQRYYRLGASLGLAYNF